MHRETTQKSTLSGSESVSKKIIVSFAVDDSLFDIDNNFSITLVHATDSLHGVVHGREIVFPSIEKETPYILLFRFKDETLSFTGITKSMIKADQNMGWKFGIDNRPFNKLSGLLRFDEFESDKKAKQLQYLQFDPMEEGNGIQVVNKIPG